MEVVVPPAAVPPSAVLKVLDRLAARGVFLLENGAEGKKDPGPL